MKKFIFVLLALISLNAFADNKPYLWEVVDLMKLENPSNGSYSDGDYTGHLIVDGKTTIIMKGWFYDSIWGDFQDCDVITAYYNSESYADTCKRNVIKGLKDWLTTFKDKNISDYAKSITANRASYMDDRGKTRTDYGVWAGLMRAEQVKMNQTK